MRVSPSDAYSIFDFMNHRWEYGQWEEYGTYIHRDDTCIYCGCIKRIAVTDDGAEVVDFYEHNHDASLKIFPCIRKSAGLDIIADPTDKRGYFKELMKKKHGFIIDLLASVRDVTEQEPIEFVTPNRLKNLPSSNIVRPAAKYTNNGYLSLLDKYAPEE